MMKRKVTSIIVCTLLIFAAVFSVAGTMIIDQSEEFLSLSSYNFSGGTCGITWDVTLSFNETSGDIDSAVFGEAPDACDGHDGGPSGNDDYDIQKAPAPMLPYVRAWFDDGLDEPFDCLHADYRQYPDTSKVWNLSVQWVPNDYVSPTDVTISWDTTDMVAGEYTDVVLYDVAGVTIVADMLVNTSYTFTASAMVPKAFQIICYLNEPPGFSDENPPDGSVDVPVTTYQLTVIIEDPEGDIFDWTIETIPDIGSSNGVGEYNGTKICSVSGLSRSTVYSWYVNATDIRTGVTSSEVYTFTTPNDPPYTPSNPYPEDGATDVSINTNLHWTGGDPNPMNTVTYDVYFGTTSPPPQVVSGQSRTTYVPGILDYGTTYYWKIVAWDNYGACTEGPIWNFTTNYLPYEPSNPDPEDGETGVNVDTVLVWSGGDPDPGNTVTYDVYFGTNSPPPQVVTGQSETTYDPGKMYHNTQYYWQIVAWDNHGASAYGPEWDFTTDVPDLDCNGYLDWEKVKPGSTVTGNFTVENIGEPDSELDWEIDDYPSWGTSWTFMPDGGEGLTPEDGQVIVQVSVVAPDEPNSEFTGEVKIVNSDDPDDYCIISAKLETPVSQNSFILQFLERLIHRFPLLEQILSSRPFLDRILSL